MTIALRSSFAAATAGEAARVTCEHCGLEVPLGLRAVDGGPSFCCNGCHTAYSLIHSCGLDRYYAMLEQSGDRPEGLRRAGRAYAEFDDATFRTLYCRDAGSGLVRTELLLEGVHCAACVWLVERLARIVPGVVESRLDMRRATVTVTFDPSVVALSKIGRVLDSIGYPPHPARSPGAREASRAADRKMLVRMAVAGACAGNIMLLFFALYAGMFDGMDRGHELLFRWVAMALNTVCLAWPGAVFARSAIGAIRARTMHLDIPIALGLYLGGAWGIWKTVASTWAGASAGASDIYFDSISALVFFLLVGRFLQQRQQRAAGDALELLFSVTPAVARRIQGDAASGHATEIPSEALRVGDVVEVRAGDCVPADGEVIGGRSSVDVSVLTGESRPVEVLAGGRVAAGSLCLDGWVRIRVEATGEATRVGKLMALVEEASRRRAAIVRLADRWGGWLLWALLGLALVTLALWWHAGATIAVDRAIALLIATCPCGLGLATPMAMTIAIGRSAKLGILVKGGDALQSLTHPGVIVLDKTGTITRGKLSVARWVGDRVTGQLAAALEGASTHPTAVALARDLAAAGPARHVREVEQRQGAGITGLVDGRRVVVGTASFLESKGVLGVREFSGHVEAAFAEGLSPVFVGVDGRCAGLAALGDAVRPDAGGAVEAMRRRGWEVRVLSGDRPEVVRQVAVEVGINPDHCHAAMSPEDKLAIVERLRASGTVVMIGDGVNDAAALGAATVGIAVRGGAEASLSAADVSMTREGLGPVVELLDGAADTMRTIHRTIASSLAYNVIAAGLSMAGHISPLLAAFIMPASSLTVVALCVKSGAFSGKVNRSRPVRGEADPAGARGVAA